MTEGIKRIVQAVLESRRSRGTGRLVLVGDPEGAATVDLFALVGQFGQGMDILVTVVDDWRNGAYCAFQRVTAGYSGGFQRVSPECPGELEVITAPGLLAAAKYSESNGKKSANLLIIQGMKDVKDDTLWIRAMLEAWLPNMEKGGIVVAPGYSSLAGSAVSADFGGRMVELEESMWMGVVE